MIPAHWEAVRRPHDEEVVGYLVPAGADVVPTSLVGTPLGNGQPASAARTLLAERGLDAVDRRWWCRLPDLLPRGLLDASVPGTGWDWRPVVVVEAAPDGIRVRPEWPAPEEMGAQAALPVPVGELLLLEPPAQPPARAARRSPTSAVRTPP